jgi:hypothetical protein
VSSLASSGVPFYRIERAGKELAKMLGPAGVRSFSGWTGGVRRMLGCVARPVGMPGACRRAGAGAAAGYRGEQERVAAAVVLLSRSGRRQRRRARQRGMEGSGIEQAGPVWFPLRVAGPAKF